MAPSTDATSLSAKVARVGRGLRAQAVQRVPPLSDERVLFNSFTGHYSDSPRAIFEYLAPRAQIDAAWVALPEAGDLPASARRVEPFSPAYLRSVGTSRFVVSNLQMPRNFQKRRGATYLQTWHGTPLKRIGFDNPRWEGNPGGLDAMARDFAKWDYLVTQNRFSTEIFRRAFRFEGEILEAGYPRNDALRAPDRDAVRTRVRRELGLDEDQTVVLYAPTWRDNVLDDAGALRFGLALELGALTEALGDSHVVLLRLHYLLAAQYGDDLAGVRNVSRHPDIRDLYLAADVLVTDYSSAMFDFAVTGKPMLFFVPDLEEYRDELRGFYFDLEEAAPGPLCRTTEEVIAGLGQPAERFASRYERFRARFCPLDDGEASRRVVERVFADRLAR